MQIVIEFLVSKYQRRSAFGDFIPVLEGNSLGVVDIFELHGYVVDDYTQHGQVGKSYAVAYHLEASTHQS